MLVQYCMQYWPISFANIGPILHEDQLILQNVIGSILANNDIAASRPKRCESRGWLPGLPQILHCWKIVEKFFSYRIIILFIKKMHNLGLKPSILPLNFPKCGFLAPKLTFWTTIFRHRDNFPTANSVPKFMKRVTFLPRVHDVTVCPIPGNQKHEFAGHTGPGHWYRTKWHYDEWLTSLFLHVTRTAKIFFYLFTAT